MSTPQSETPRTDAAEQELYSGGVDRHYDGVQGFKLARTIEHELGEANDKINSQANSLCNIADSCRVRGEVSMSKPLDERVIACFHKYEKELSQVRGELHHVGELMVSAQEAGIKLIKERDLLAKQNHKMREYLTHRLTKFDGRSLTTAEHGEQNWINSALSNDTTSLIVLPRAEVEKLPCDSVQYGYKDCFDYQQKMNSDLQCPRCLLLERFEK